MTQYYVSTSGTGSSNGLSSGAPWTFAQLLAATLSSGDLVTFKGGDTFSGPLIAQAGVTYDMYGTGTPTISGGTSAAVTATNVGGWELDHLTLTGTVPGSDGTGGPRAVVAVAATSTSGTRYAAFTITSCIITGGQCGINVVCPSTASDGFTAPQITHNTISNATEFGMYLQEDGSTNNHQHFSDAYIAHNTVTNITGDSNPATASGCGIVLGNCQGNTTAVTGIIELNVVTDCGKAATQTDAGPAGIFPIDCDQITVRENVVGRIHTAGGIDGAGIGGDLNTTSCIFERNYIYDCDGSGLYNISDSFGFDNTYRFNFVINCSLTQDTAIRDQSGGIWHNNTVISRLAKCFNFSGGSGVKVYENVFLNQGDVIGSAGSGTVMNGNLYWTTFAGGAFSVTYNGTNYTTISAFRTGSGQENFGGTPRGVSADPLLYNPYASTQISDPTTLTGLLAGKGLSGSPVLGAGLDLSTLFGINPGAVDFNGNSISSVPYAIGAFNTQGTRPSGSDLKSTVQSLAPMFYHRLDETSGTIAADSSGNNYQSTYEGGVTLGQSSLVTSGTHSALLNGTTGAIKLDTNFKWDHLTALSGLVVAKGTFSGSGALLGHWNSTQSLARVLVYATAGNISIVVYDAVGMVFCIGTSANTFADNAAHVIVWTWTGATFQLWVDGVSQTINYDSGNHHSIPEITAAATAPRIGASSDVSPDLFFAGNVQENALFGYVLNGTQAGAIWTASSVSAALTVSNLQSDTTGLIVTGTLSVSGCTPTSGTLTSAGTLLGEDDHTGTASSIVNWTISGTTITWHLDFPLYPGQSGAIGYGASNGEDSGPIVDGSENPLADFVLTIANNSDAATPTPSTPTGNAVSGGAHIVSPVPSDPNILVSVYRDGELLDGGLAWTGSYDDTGLTNGTTYTYTMTYTPHGGTESAHSGGLALTPPGSITGTGAATVPSPTGSGSAALKIAGSGAATAPSPTGSGNATLITPTTPAGTCIVTGTARGVDGTPKDGVVFTLRIRPWGTVNEGDIDTEPFTATSNGTAEGNLVFSIERGVTAIIRRGSRGNTVVLTIPDAPAANLSDLLAGHVLYGEDQ